MIFDMTARLSRSECLARAFRLREAGRCCDLPYLFIAAYQKQSRAYLLTAETK